MIIKESNDIEIINSVINQLNIDIASYQDAIINNYDKDPLSQDTIDYYESQIAGAQQGISALEQEKIKLGG